MNDLDDYAIAHADRINLLAHLVLVPLFSAGIVVALWGAPVTGALLTLGSIGLQGASHRRESERPRFDGPRDFVGRILREQLVTFPRFLLSGRFRDMLKGDDPRRDRREAGATRP